MIRKISPGNKNRIVFSQGPGRGCGITGWSALRYEQIQKGYLSQVKRTTPAPCFQADQWQIQASGSEAEYPES